MNRLPRRIAVGMTTGLLAVSSLASTTSAFARVRHHPPAPIEQSIPGDFNGIIANGPLPNPQGQFAGAGGFYSPDYIVPGEEAFQLGAQMLGGGAVGASYIDYHRHLYYYKNAYCPIGASYSFYTRRCTSLSDLFK